MNPTWQLKQEHARIEEVLDVLERLGPAAEQGHADLEDCARALEFVRLYADELHHGKEEEVLFPALEAAGMPRQRGPIGCMLHEHDEGRAAVASMRAALDGLRRGDGLAGPAFAAGAARYVALLRQHILKENQVLFPMAEDLLSEAQKAELLEAFARVERARLDPITRQRLLEDLAALTDRVAPV